jgi:hypothetical protein
LSSRLAAIFAVAALAAVAERDVSVIGGDPGAPGAPGATGPTGPDGHFTDFLSQGNGISLAGNTVAMSGSMSGTITLNGSSALGAPALAVDAMGGVAIMTIGATMLDPTAGVLLPLYYAGAVSGVTGDTSICCDNPGDLALSGGCDTDPADHYWFSFADATRCPVAVSGWRCRCAHDDGSAAPNCNATALCLRGVP